ncbi:uncharacterized protein LOC127242636 [Andrographis paniculata]|uniref:uncharacterized protein LOC127242636 n=1 Tax=Andrographis paniculata TaxID=175694 RepID=UPI0021E771D9|nr:uncharacterized protein LOC127242636 [Andrographis paniculata]
MSNRYPFSPAPLTCLSSSERRRFRRNLDVSAVRRRHHRRRILKKYAPDLALPPPHTPTIFKLSDDTFQISLNPTLNSIQRLEARLNQFLDYGREAFDDLRTLVTVDRSSGGFTITCRRSTIEFFVALFISSFVVVVALRGLFKPRNSGGEVLIYRRDRSLGGKEVVVGSRETNWSTSRKLTPLNSSDNERNYGRERNRATMERRKKAELPQWWPQVVNSVSDESINKEEYQRMVNQLVQAIMDRKMTGEDISTNDVVQLRHICKTYGVRAFINTENARDSLYRMSINFVLDFCESISTVSTSIDSIQINGEDVREFVAGLADNIGLESARAVRMVSAAVAARTRSKILQAWALEVQNKHSDALAELFKVCLIHRTFPPEENSPEMEMVARGLDKSLSTDQREHILNSFITICGDDIDRSVVEALGLN